MTATPRNTYRHGDLRRALLDAGIELARAGGPDAVVLREATRRAGVAPNAAYRHFANRDDLLGAVRAAAVAAAARFMEAELERAPLEGSATEQARAKVRAVGAGYLRFAQTETGLFRTAFGGQFSVQQQPDPAMGAPRAATRLSISARRWTIWWQRARCPQNAGTGRNTWPGPPCTAWRC